MLKNLFEDPSNLTPGEARASVQAANRWITWILFGVIFPVIVFAVIPMEPVNTLFLVQAAVKLSLAAIATGIPKLIMAAICSLGLAQWIENTKWGQRAGNQAVVLAALLLAAAVLFKGSSL
jgi:hypothetical protein